MNRDDLIRLARDAGAPDWWICLGVDGVVTGSALLFLALLLARAAQDFDRFAADREMLAAHRAMARAHLAFRASLVVMGDRLRDAVHHDQSNRGDPATFAEVPGIHFRRLKSALADVQRLRGE